MSFLKKLTRILSLPSSSEINTLMVHVRCSKCGEIIQSRINLNNDISIDYGETEKDTRYFCRKVLIGEGRCYQPIELSLTFDQNRSIIDRKIKGGTFVEEQSRRKLN